MDQPARRTVDSVSALDATLDARQVPPAVDPRPCPVGMITGSTPQLTVETANLLRFRLRLAALLTCVSSLAFLLWRLTMAPISDPTAEWMLTAVLSLAVLVPGFWSIVLCSKLQPCINSLRLAELMIFGTPVLVLLYVTWFRAPELARTEIQMHLLPHWMTLIFIYCMFIPNSARRAACFVLPIAMLPITSLVLLRYLNADMAKLYTDNTVIEAVLIQTLTAITALAGTHIINHLRHEAFEARLLGQYRLKQLLGAGGMGEVYLAEHQLLKRPCAVKLIRASRANDPQALARFEREVQSTARLTHWNCVEIFDYGRTADGTFYYVMEYLRGLSLAELVNVHGPLPPERTVHLLQQICDALAEAHSLGLIHRDIKPSNIFAATRGGVHDVAKLLDFGLVKQLHSPNDDLQLSTERGVTGSPLYLSPEQALGDIDLDPRSDIYSLGAVAYFLLTGHSPFERENALKVLFAHAHDPVPPMSQYRSDVPADLEEIIMRCLAKSRDDRYPCVRKLQAALARCESAGRWGREEARQWWRGHTTQPEPLETCPAS